MSDNSTFSTHTDSAKSSGNVYIHCRRVEQIRHRSCVNKPLPCVLKFNAALLVRHSLDHDLNGDMVRCFRKIRRIRQPLYLKYKMLAHCQAVVCLEGKVYRIPRAKIKLKHV